MFWKSVEQTTFLCGFCQHLIASVKGNITVFKALQPSYTVIPEKKSLCAKIRFIGRIYLPCFAS